MKPSKSRHFLPRLLVVLFSAGLSFSTFQVASEDIDIFSVDVDQTANKPNVLIILDNSANWSRQAQQWPGGLTQGESEVRAIRDVILGIPNNPQFPGLEDNSINVGIMEYITGGSAGDSDSGYVRMHIVPMNGTNKPVLAGHMNQIFNNINAPDEKRSQGNPYGNLMWDAYNYLAGTNASQGGTGTLDSLSDDAGYTTKHSVFRSPLASTDTCTRTVIIFIGNNNQQGPVGDSAANASALAGLGGDTVQIPFANYDIVTQHQTAYAGYYANACYSNDAAGLSACTDAEDTTTACTDAGFTSCLCRSDAASTPPQTCASLAEFDIYGQPVTETVVSGPTSTSTTGVATGEATKCQNNNPGSYTCPGSTTTSQDNTPIAGQRTVTTTSWSNCAYVAQANACGNNNNKTEWTPRGTKTETKTVYEQTLGAFEAVGAVSTCRSSEMSCTSFDFPASCSDGTYSNCRCESGTGNTGACGSPPPGSVQFPVWGNLTATIEAVADGTFRPAPTGTGGAHMMADEWARYLREVGVTLPGGSGAKTQVSTYTLDVFNAQQHVDISALLFNMARVGGGKYFQAKDENQIRDALQQIFDEIQAVNSAFSSASLPVNATNRAQNENQVFIGVFRPSRTKAPQWFGNLKRFQVIASQGGFLTLGDSNGSEAINDATGFLSDCAVSFWTTPSGDYWQNVITDDPPAVGNCSSAPGTQHSDSPDGPYVEKGAVAEVLRKGNNPSATTNAEGNYAVNRNLKTRSGGTLVDFSVSSLPNIDRDGDGTCCDADDDAIKDRIARFIRGEDVFDDDLDAATAPISGLTEPRSTIHGDVIHSRPQPINFGDFDGDPSNGSSPGVVIFYGANDGTYRAVRASDGVELWSFVAPEHYGKFGRLTNNAPNIRYFGDTLGEPKDYFFDGSTGVFQNADNSKVYIYPTMRRGGRKIYAFNVTDDPNNASDGAANPTYMWSKGCDSTGVCDNDLNGNFSAMGQTWSLPAPGFIAGVSSGTQPIVVFGGGYDPCEDGNTATPTCGSANGRGVYVVNGETGALIRHFDFSGLAGARSVAADVQLIDVNFDGKADHVYAVDTGGSVYRASFLKADGTPETDPTLWTFRRIARTDPGGRKFLFAPALFQATGNVVYVTLGTGDREAPLIDQYPYTTPVLNRFYVFKDDLTNSTAEIDLDVVSPSNMLDYTTEASPCCNAPVLPGDPTTNDGDPTTEGYDTQPKGWFIDLNADGQNLPGEQTVTSAVIVAGLVFFSTNRPTLPSGTACENSLGEARGYIVNLFNGSGAIGVPGTEGGDRSTVFTGGGLPPSPVVATVPIDGVLTTIVIGGAQKDGATSSYLDTQEPPIPIQTRRTPLYWFKTTDAE
jgi:hypothetical protein